MLLRRGRGRCTFYCPGQKHPPSPPVFKWNHLEVFGVVPQQPRFQWSSSGLIWRRQILPFVLTFFHICQVSSPEFSFVDNHLHPASLFHSCLSPPLAKTVPYSPISLNFLTLWGPPFLSPICIMSNYRSRRVSTGSSSVPSHQSLCLCLLVYLLLLFSALSWRPDGTQVSGPHGGSYCKLSLHPQPFKTLPEWDFIYFLRVFRALYLTYLTQFHTACWCLDYEGKKNKTLLYGVKAYCWFFVLFCFFNMQYCHFSLCFPIMNANVKISIIGTCILPVSKTCTGYEQIALLHCRAAFWPFSRQLIMGCVGAWSAVGRGMRLNRRHGSELPYESWFTCQFHTELGALFIYERKILQVLDVFVVCVGKQAGWLALVRARLTLQSPMMPISPNSHGSRALVTEVEHHRLYISVKLVLDLCWWVCVSAVVLNPSVVRKWRCIQRLCTEASSLAYLDSVFHLGCLCHLENTLCILKNSYLYLSASRWGLERADATDAAKHNVGYCSFFKAYVCYIWKFWRKKIDIKWLHKRRENHSWNQRILLAGGKGRRRKSRQRSSV